MTLRSISTATHFLAFQGWRLAPTVHFSLAAQLCLTARDEEWRDNQPLELFLASLPYA